MKLTFPTLSAFAAGVFFFSCSQKEPTPKSTDPSTELHFELVDSIRVDVLEDLTILDYLESADRYLMKERRGEKIILTDGKGNVISNQELAGEGPNQVPTLWEGRFFGADGYIFKEMSATMDFHVYNLDFQKTEKIDQGCLALQVFQNRWCGVKFG